MPHFLLVILQIAVLLGIAAAIVRPGLRARLAPGLGTLSVLALAGALWAGAEPRQLEVTATFPAYDELVIVPTAFVVDRVTAPASRWWLLACAFAAGWAVWAWTWRRRSDPGPFALPLGLAWTSALLVLLWQKSAAPAALVQPAGLDRGLWPATLAAGLILAARSESLLRLILSLSVLVALVRLPVAIAAVLASNNHWGTSLDVSSITLFANPVIQQPVEVDPGSAEQQMWLIWLQHLVMMPGIYMMSVGGIAFAVHLYLKHPAPPP